MTSDRRRDLSEAFDEQLAAVPESVDRAALERIRTVAYVLDESIEIPGTNYSIGLDPLIGAVPVVGDAISGAISLYIVLESARLGVSYTTLLEMIANVSLDYVGGSIPYVGTVFDAVWKANKRNLELVLEDLTTQDDESSDDPDDQTDDEPGSIEIEVEPATR